MKLKIPGVCWKWQVVESCREFVKKYSETKLGRPPGLRLGRLVCHDNTEDLCSIDNGKTSEVLNWKKKLIRAIWAGNI